MTKQPIMYSVEVFGVSGFCLKKNIFLNFVLCVNVIGCVFKLYFVEINDMSSLHVNLLI